MFGRSLKLKRGFIAFHITEPTYYLKGFIASVFREKTDYLSFIDLIIAQVNEFVKPFFKKIFSSFCTKQMFGKDPNKCSLQYFNSLKSLVL